eukprot:s197_g22.t1
MVSCWAEVSTDSGMLGLLPGCFSNECRGPEDYDDLLSTLAREGKMQRAFTMCFDDGPEGGGKLFLGKPEVPNDATIISLVPLTNGQSSYSPLSTFDGNSYVEFYFGHALVGSQKVMEWNNMMQNNQGYSDTGTPGLMLPSSVYMKIFDELRQGLATDEQCFSLWGYSIQSLQTGAPVTVSEPAANCAMPFLKDFEVKLGPGVSIIVSKSSFFYETEPCSKQYGISWVSNGGESMIFGTALNYGKSILYDTTDLSAPKMVVLGPAQGCTRDYSAAEGAKPLVLKGVPGQVLGRDGTITAELTLGTPGQQLTVQLDTGSQKFMGIHQTCRNLGNCFLVEPAPCLRGIAARKGLQHGHMPRADSGRLQSIVAAVLPGSPGQNAVRALAQRDGELGQAVGGAIGRKICGDRVDFEPVHSSTFQKLGEDPARVVERRFLGKALNHKVVPPQTHLCARSARGPSSRDTAVTGSGAATGGDYDDTDYQDGDGYDGYDSGYDGYDSYDGGSGSGYDDYDDYDYSNEY